MSDVIRAEGPSVVAAFEAWVRAQPQVRLVVIEGYPGSGKSHLLSRLPVDWRTLEIDRFLGKDHDQTVGWIELARRCGVEAIVRRELASHPLVIAEGPAAWPVLDSLLEELGPRARRVYLQHWLISGGAPHWINGDDRQFWVETANHEFWRDIMRHHAGEPEHRADLILQRVSVPPTPASVFEELKALSRP
jgi:hypothetical protein